MHKILKFILGMKIYVFRIVPLFIIRSFSLSTAMVYVRKSVWHIPLLCVQWKTPDDGLMNCPKHVDFHSKDEFEKSAHLVSFIIRYLTRCTFIWTSNLPKIVTHDRCESFKSDVRTSQHQEHYAQRCFFHICPVGVPSTANFTLSFGLLAPT